MTVVDIVDWRVLVVVVLVVPVVVLKFAPMFAIEVVMRTTLALDTVVCGFVSSCVGTVIMPDSSHAAVSHKQTCGDSLQSCIISAATSGIIISKIRCLPSN